MKTVGLFFNRTEKITGCSKVADNTLNGLREIGVDVLENRLGDMNGCLHGVEAFRNKTLPQNTLIGVEIIVLPSENQSMYSRWKHFVHPHEWVREYMLKFPVAQKVKHYVWPAGIDQRAFNDNLRSNTFKYDVLIYYKNVTKQTPESDLKKVERELSRRRLTFKTIKYGFYKEDEMKKLTADCKICIYLAGSESQGIALMEMMSCGIPIYVMDTTVFKYQGFSHTSNNVSSAPYFDENCGEKVIGVNFSKLDTILQNYDKYMPREYILDNHTLAKGAQKYLDILEEINNV